MASVRFLTRLPSRTLSRSKYAGRELRLGIVSMCMTHTSHDSPASQLSHRVADMATFHPRDQAPMLPKTLSFPKVPRQLPPTFTGNFGTKGSSRIKYDG